MNSDRLLEILSEKLNKDEAQRVSRENLLRDTAALYMAELMGQGFIPYRLLDELETELMETLEVMYRVKTYGSVRHQIPRRRTKKLSRE